MEKIREIRDLNTDLTDARRADCDKRLCHRGFSPWVIGTPIPWELAIQRSWNTLLTSFAGLGTFWLVWIRSFA